MKWVTATVGALLVFVGATIMLLFVSSQFYPFLFDSVAEIVATFVVVIGLGAFAGYHSFRASLKVHDEAKVEKEPPRLFDR